MTPFVKVIEIIYIPLWVKRDFTIYNDDFIRIRSGYSYKYKCDHCEKCNHKFEIGERIALAAFKNIGNKGLCDACAKEISI